MPKPPTSRGRARARVADTATLPLFASAMRQSAAADRVAVEERPSHLSTGLRSLDQALRGGLAVGEATLVASRPRVGATSLLLGAALEALKRGERVAYFSDQLAEEQLRGRFVVLESRVNGYRFRAGFVSADDRIALVAARQRIPWSALSMITRRRILPEEVDGHLFSYRPWLVVADILAGDGDGSGSQRTAALLAQVEALSSIARRHQVAMLVRAGLPCGQHAPNRLELPGVGAMAEAFSAVVLLHREEVTDPTGAPDESAGRAEARVVRVKGHDVEPRLVSLRFDQRFAGLLEL